MLNELRFLLSKILDANVDIIKKDRFTLRKNIKFFPIDKNYIFVYDKNIPTKTLYEIKLFLGKFLSKYEKNIEDLKKLKILQKELDNILKSNELFFSKKGDLKDFFIFLEDQDIDFSLIENQKEIINKNIDNFTINVTLNKLKKSKELSLPIKSGEIFAIKEGFYIVILQSNKKIDEFTKKVIRSRLLWLNALYEAKMLYEIDKLTGLYTRSKFLDEVVTKLKNSSFLFINIKNFKVINEIYSSYIGDKILQEISQKLKKYYPEEKLYRIYGDRFAIAFKKEKLDQIFKIFKEKIDQNLLIYNKKTKEYVQPNLDFQILFFENYVDEILEKANASFKKSNKEISYFSKDIEPILKEEIEYFKILLHALENENVIPYFQRVVEKNSAKTIYFEALMRIAYEEKIFTPVKFIEIAKEKGLYKKLNSIMIKKSIKSAKKLSKKISINIDIYDVLQKDFIENIKKIIEENKIAPSLIQFEILETENIYEYFNEVKIFIEKIKKIGCSVALDDFGKGYSNFSSIVDLNIDSIKVDMSLVKNIDKDKKSFSILQAICEFATLLNIKTTAEGVGNKNIYEKISKLNIDYIQGFFIDKPKPLKDIIKE